MWFIKFVRGSWIWGLVCNPRFWPRVVLSCCFFWLIEPVKVEPVEEFTARLFATVGSNMGWEYHSWEEGVHCVQVPHVVRGQYTLQLIIAPPCTYLSLFVGLLPWIYSRRRLGWLTCVRGVCLVTTITLVANISRVLSWMELMRWGWFNGDMQKLMPGYIVSGISFALLVVYWERYLDQPVRPKQKVCPSIESKLVLT